MTIYLYRIDGKWVAKNWQSIKLTKNLTGFQLEQWIRNQKSDYTYAFDGTGERYTADQAIQMIKNDLALFQTDLDNVPMVHIPDRQYREYGRSVE